MVSAVTPRLPKASMDAFGGGALHSRNFTSGGEPGMLVGWKLFETISKMPAFSRSASRVSLKDVSRAALRGSLVEGLKLAAARRIFSTPKPVPVGIQSFGGGEGTVATTKPASVSNPRGKLAARGAP